MANGSLVFYKDWFEAFADLTPEERLRAYDAVMSYAFDGVVPEDRFIKAITALVRAAIDRDNQRFEETCRKRSESGRKGGQANQANASKCKQNQANQANACEIKQIKQNQANQADNENDNENENENENEGCSSSPMRVRASHAEPLPPDELKQQPENAEDMTYASDDAVLLAQGWKKAGFLYSKGYTEAHMERLLTQHSRQEIELVTAYARQKKSMNGKGKNGWMVDLRWLAEHFTDLYGEAVQWRDNAAAISYEDFWKSPDLDGCCMLRQRDDRGKVQYMKTADALAMGVAIEQANLRKYYSSQ